ncbi:hypothetical protein ACG9Y7_18425 [Acinetobacter gerneri]|uniref:hypothetical protein n=1 Tax=Acinetobacter gerneri TaxID=202952 RepID=UPI003AF59649
MDTVKDYLDDQLSVLKLDLSLTLEQFYSSKDINDFSYPFEIIEIIKNNIIEDGIKDKVEINSIGHTYLYRLFDKKQDESTEYFYYKMMVSLAFCEFYSERNNYIAVIRHLNSYHFYNGVIESKNGAKIQKLQRIDDGRKKGQNDSLESQKIIKALLLTKVWDNREQFYICAHEEVNKHKISRSIKSIKKDFNSVRIQVKNYNDYFKHQGKK